jgi:M6 family metalloprotease-like protein
MNAARRCGQITLLALFIASIGAGLRPATAAPVFGEQVALTQPDGTVVQARAWGDEYHQRLEDLAGYTLVRDPRDGGICYARLADDELVSTGVRAGEAPPVGIVPGLRLPEDVVASRVASARKAAGWPAAGEKIDYPLPASTGEVRGIALMVDFSDAPGEISPEQLDRFLNELGYDDDGNNGSVRDYYRDVSAGRLDLTHTVSGYYYRAAHPKEWYDDPNASQGWRARQLVTEAIQDLDRRGFDFSEYDANGDGYIDLISCFYAGGPTWSWGRGLWPQAGEFGFQADGVTGRIWQVTPMRDTLRLGIPVHEIGHALMQWDDLYDPSGDSWGVGLFCVMSNPTSNANPVAPCGPLKLAAGWTENVLLDGVMLDQTIVAGENRLFYRPHPRIDAEFYVLENRAARGRDAAITDEGLAIYHVDWRGSNNYEARLPDAHYMVTLVQADGRWDLENDANFGDDTDLFGAPDFTRFGPDTQPPATWWRGQDAAVHLEEISAPGDTMTFDYSDGIGILPLELVVDPADHDWPWRIIGADGFVKTGDGSRTVYVPTEGSYLVSWLPVAGWIAPPPATVYVPQDGPTPEVRVAYTHPPFVQTFVPALDAPAAGRGGQLVDHDDDGDLDVFLCREDGGDLLLRNEGGWQFVDATPPALAADGPTIGAAWADADGDGDQDVLIVRRGQPAQFLRQERPGVFESELETLPAGLDSLRGATWLDYDRDGRLDLHLVREGVADLLLRHPDKSGPRIADYVVQDVLPGFSFARTVAGAWCDYDADGRLDVYMVNSYGANVLARNQLPGQFANATHGGLGLPWRGGMAAWGDHDHDGDFDLLVVQDGAPDVLLTQYDGTFVMESEPLLETPGAGRDAVWADFDNDGNLDVFLARAGEPDRLVMNLGDGIWAESPLLMPELAGQTVAVLAGDLDDDGGVDLILDRDGAAPLALRNTMNRGHWLTIELEGSGSLQEPAGTVGRAHVGDAIITRQVAPHTGPGHPAARLHFGIGSATVIDSLEIRWPIGRVEVLRDVAVDQVLTLTQPTPGGTGGSEIPAVTELLPAYPNPFNPGTTLAFTLASGGTARLEVFDVRGRRVATVHDGDLAAGRHEFRWNGRSDGGRGVASGVYVARFQAGAIEQTRRLTLVR